MATIESIGEALQACEDLRTFLEEQRKKIARLYELLSSNSGFVIEHEGSGGPSWWAGLGNMGFRHELPEAVIFHDFASARKVLDNVVDSAFRERSCIASWEEAKAIHDGFERRRRTRP